VVATVLLARLLTPGDFGIVALAQSIMNIATLLGISGVNAALVTRKSQVQEAASSYFWLAALLGVCIALGFLLLARPIATALGQPAAGPYVAVLSISFAFSTLALVPNALLQRSFNFRWLNLSMAVGALTYFILEVVLAYRGWGAWAVVAGQVAGAFCTLSISLCSSRWLPRLHFSLADIRSDLRLTGGLGLGQILTYLDRNIDYWVVSHSVGGPALGVYYIAYVLPNIVRLRISTVVRQVILPAYAEVATVAKTAELWRRTFPAVMGLGVPLLVGIAAVTQPLVATFFGSQWEQAVMPMRLLTLASLVDLLLTSVATLAIVHRLVRQYLLVLAFRTSSTALLTILAVAFWGSLTAVAGAILVSAVMTLVVQQIAIGRPLAVGLETIARPLATYCAFAIVMASGIELTLRSLDNGIPAFVQLAVSALVGGFLYFGLGWLMAPRLLRPVMLDGLRLAAGR
jgi:PST family polysaccharide transporter